MKIKAAVVAGTPVDTGMGVDFLNGIDPEITAVPYAFSDRPEGCHLMQLEDEAAKEQRLHRLWDWAEENGTDAIFVYCNSLSGTFDFEAMAEKRGLVVTTPLMVYRTLGAKYKRAAVIAANNQSTAGIEKEFYRSNPHISVPGLGYLALVEAIESGLSPAAIVEQFRLDTLMRFFEQNGADCLILGCTHFPYLKEELSKHTSMPIIDPAELMYEMLAGVFEK